MIKFPGFENLDWTIVFNGIPKSKSGASSILFFQYLSSILSSSNSVQCIILSDKNVESSEIEELKSDLGRNPKLNIHLIVSKNPLIKYKRWSIEIDKDLKIDVGKTISQYNNTMLMVFDFPSSLYLTDAKNKYRFIWLGDLMYDSFYYHYIYSLKENFFRIKQYFDQLIFKFRLKKKYHQVLKHYNLVIVSSMNSTNSLKKLNIESTFSPYPWPSNFKPNFKISENKKKKPEFLFYGHLFGLGSRSALHFLFFKLYPMLVKKWGSKNFKIKIGGREIPADWVLSFIERKPEFEFLGFINDIEKEFLSSDAVIIPIDVPVGNRSRIITAQSAGSLVIAHQNSSLGNPYLIHKENCYLASNAEDFINCMEFAYNERSMSQKIRTNAYNSYLESYSPDSALKYFYNLIKNKLIEEKNDD